VSELEVNRRAWDGRVPVHVASKEMYDLDAFKSGRSTLRPLDLEEVGDVRGLDLLHLQCHLGLDTLSWARLGARVVGVDFSEPALEVARSLATELGLGAEFICAEVGGLELGREFDLVYSSRGVLCWLPDLRLWARVIARHLRPGGRLYLQDGSPVATMYEEEAGRLEIRYPYFNTGPIEETLTGTYGDESVAMEPSQQYEWSHPYEEVLGSLLEAGLRLEWLHEQPYLYWKRYPSMRRDEQGNWRLPGDPIPLQFSLLAHKP